MTTIFDQWAAHWQVPVAAANDLLARMSSPPDAALPGASDQSEAAVSARTRVLASQMGMRLWRNNVGAFHDNESGTHIRFGLANDSPAVNRVVKSADLIGIWPRAITPADVGRVIGQFVSVECKRGGWKWTGSDRDVAQQNWLALIGSLGGHARRVTDAGQLL